LDDVHDGQGMTKMTAETRTCAPEALLLVDIADVRCAFPVRRVTEVLPAARVTPLPGAPETVAGVVNVRGAPVVVVDGHRCVDRAAPPLHPTDRFVVLDSRAPRLAIRVDGVRDIREIADDDPVSEVSVATDPSQRHTIALLPDGVVVIRDPITFVTDADVRSIRAALERLREGQS